MRIAIDLTALSYHITGIERYAMCMTEKMIMLDKVNSYLLIFRNSIYPVFKEKIDGERIKEYIVRGNNKLFFYQIILPLHLYKIKADKYLFFAFTSPLLFRKKGIYNTIHDMGPWDSSDSLRLLQKIYLRTTCKWSARVSERIITVSEFSKGRIVEILNYPSNRIDVIYSAVHEGVVDTNDNSYEDVKNQYCLPNKYIMTLSTLEPRKNLVLLLEAYSHIMDKVDYDLVLVGRKGWKMDDVIEKYNSQRRIHITGYVEDEHVSLIYKNARCFVFPTLYEGFGLPPIEALAMGTPVISSDAASMPEILRNQAMYFKSGDKNKLQELLLDLDSNIDNMSHGLDDFQKYNYRFDVSAKKILTVLMHENV